MTVHNPSGFTGAVRSPHVGVPVAPQIVIVACCMLSIIFRVPEEYLMLEGVAICQGLSDDRNGLICGCERISIIKVYKRRMMC